MDRTFDAADAGRRAKTGPVISRAKIKRVALGMALAVAVAVGGQAGYRYWTVGRYLESTDDAYVKSDYTTVAPKVSGYIAAVLVRDNQRVAAGQILARIDDRDFRAALDQARAETVAADAAIRNFDAQLVLQKSVIDQEKADITATQAALKFAQADHARYQNLMKTGSGTVQRAQLAEATLREKTAQLQRDQAALVAAQSKIAVLMTERGKAEAERDRSRAV
jgi:membrane fusion protein, multidrug efflux system